MAVQFGLEPFDMNVRLPTDADFVSSMTSSAGDWAVGDAFEFRLSASSAGTSPIVWAATVVGPVASWDVSNSPDVRAAISAGVSYARLHYLPGTGGDRLIGKGRAQVD